MKAPDHPKVAIVTPVYNGGKFLRETMETVQAQDYPNLVHIVLDNCSTDDTADIIAEYSDADVPVLAFKNEEVLPLYSNWNAALRHVPDDADYVRLLCADDKMTPDCTSKMVEVAVSDPEILLVGVNVTKNDEPFEMLWRQDETVLEGKDVVRRFFKNEIGFFAVHMLMKKSVMEWRQPIYDDRFVGGDFESVLAILQHGKFGMVHDVLGWVRIHEGSETAKTIVKKNTHFIDWLKTLYVHGPSVMSDSEFNGVKRRFERYYLRKILRWRMQAGAEASRPHLHALSETRGPLRSSDYVSAAYEYVLIKLGLRPHWVGWPN